MSHIVFFRKGMFIKRKWHAKFLLNMSKHIGEKCGKLRRTETWMETWMETRTEGHSHTIIRPV